MRDGPLGLRSKRMNELISQLMSQLNVGEDQARGGAGVLFKLVKEKLSSEDFSSVVEKLGDLDGLINGAPQGERGGAGSLLGSLASAVGGEKLGNLASAFSGFKELGLDTEMIGKFISVVFNFIKDRGDESVLGLLKGVLND